MLLYDPAIIITREVIIELNIIEESHNPLMGIIMGNTAIFNPAVPAYYSIL